MTLVPSARTMTAKIDEVRRPLPRCPRVMVIGNAKRNVFVCEDTHDTWRIPTKMPKLEAVTSIRRQHSEKGR